MRGIVLTIAIVTASAVAWTNTAQAADEPAPSVDAAAPKQATAQENRPEHFRVNLGVGLAAIGGGNGWQLLPMTSLGFDVHAAGPVWITAALNAGYWKTEGTGMSDSTSKSVGGRLGVRVEAPVFDWLEAGGYALFVAGYSDSGDDSLRFRSLTLGGVAGVSAHLRASRFFGVRLFVEAFHAGIMYSNVEETFDDGVTSSAGGGTTFVDFVPRPGVDLTFTF